MYDLLYFIIKCVLDSETKLLDIECIKKMYNILKKNKLPCNVINKNMSHDILDIYIDNYPNESVLFYCKQFKTILDTLLNYEYDIKFITYINNNKFITKLDKTWFKIDPSIKSFGEKFIYFNYKKKWPYINKDFDKYTKLYGLIITKDKWKKKMRSVPINDKFNIPSRPITFTINLLMKLGNWFKEKSKTKKIYWPMMTSIISDSTLRDRSDYFLISADDILKIDIISSILYDDDDKNAFIDNFFDKITNYTFDDINLLKDKYMKDKYTCKILQNVYKKKR